MPRKKRVFIKNMPYHILLNSIKNISPFEYEEDKEYFIDLIKKYSKCYEIEIHSYILTSKYFEFLSTSMSHDSFPKFMQNVGRLYVSYYNKKYKRTGTLWHGRYKASLVEPTEYILDVMSFIERRTKTKYSSLAKNLFGLENIVVKCHEKYKSLGTTKIERLEKYKYFFEKDIKEVDSFILSSLLKQNVTGTPEFTSTLEKKLGLSLTPKKRGRPQNSIKKRNNKLYKNLQILNKEKHFDLKLLEMEDLFFAKKLDSIPVLANELSTLGKSLPVVFKEVNESTILSMIVSLGNINLAIDEEGKWITNYLPIALKKYPFSLATFKDNKEEKVIMIDEESSFFSRSKGKPLFNKDGFKSETLQTEIKFLLEVDKYTQLTKGFISEISKSGILEEREILVGEGEEKKVLVDGFKVVSREKLNKLNNDILSSWVRKGIISFIDEHLKSLENISTLFKLASKRQN